MMAAFFVSFGQHFPFCTFRHQHFFDESSYQKFEVVATLCTLFVGNVSNFSITIYNSMFGSHSQNGLN